MNTRRPYQTANVHEDNLTIAPVLYISSLSQIESARLRLLSEDHTNASAQPGTQLLIVSTSYTLSSSNGLSARSGLTILSFNHASESELPRVEQCDSLATSMLQYVQNLPALRYISPGVGFVHEGAVSFDGGASVLADRILLMGMNLT